MYARTDCEGWHLGRFELYHGKGGLPPELDPLKGGQREKDDPKESLKNTGRPQGIDATAERCHSRIVVPVRRFGSSVISFSTIY